MGHLEAFLPVSVRKLKKQECTAPQCAQARPRLWLPRLLLPRPGPRPRPRPWTRKKLGNLKIWYYFDYLDLDLDIDSFDNYNIGDWVYGWSRVLLFKIRNY